MIRKSLFSLSALAALSVPAAAQAPPFQSNAPIASPHGF
jgi:hypothetical protein